MSEDVTKWLGELGLGQYAIAFAESDIDWDLLPELDHETLMHIGVSSPGHRLRILKAAQSFQGGSKEDRSSGHAEAERRQITVMFCDLVGSTALSSKLDVEDMRDILLQFQDACAGVIKRYEGFIARYMGDGVLVYFGYPAAHENDSERAIRAGLEIIDAVTSMDANRAEQVGEELAVRIGVASGNVVVGDIIGEGASQEAAITGEAPNLAARVQSVAAPNTLVIAEATQRLAGPLFQYTELEPKLLKGFAAPQRVFQVIGEAGSEVAETEQDRAMHELVGRKAELRHLTALADCCLETGSGQVIVIRGEAGIGKSRLVAEFVSVARARGFLVKIGLVLGFGVGMGRDAIRVIVRQILNIPTDADESLRKQMANAAIEHGLVVVDQRMFLNDLLDLPQALEVKSVYDAMDNATRTEGRRITVASLILNASRNDALLLVVEDVHWADPEILGYLSRVTSVVSECPTVLIMTSRVEGDPLDQAWRSVSRAEGMVTLDLGPLQEEDAIAFAGSVSDATQRFVLDCVARAEGNPLFLEQMLLNAQEGGEEAIPPSLQSLIVARLDRLAKIDKQALQAASAIGQRFMPDVLCHVLGNANYKCNTLVAQHLLRPQGDEFLFAHALIQDVAYDSQLKSTKRMLHKRAAEWFVDRDMTLNARHLDLAEDPGAGRAYVNAATQLMTSYGFEQARTLLERGLELSNPDDVQFELMCARGEVLLALGLSEDALDTYKQAAGKAANDQTIFRAHIGLAQAARQASRYESALDSLKIAEASALRTGTDLDLAQVHYLRGNIYFPLGRIDESLESNERAIAYALKTGSTRLHVGALSGFGDANYLKGAMRTAGDYYTQAIDLARPNNLTRDLAANLHNRSVTRLYTGSILPALADAEESLDLARTYFVPVAACVARTCLTLTYLIVDDLHSAQESAAENVHLTNEIGAKRFEAQARSDLARVLALQGKYVEARRFGREGVSLALEFARNFAGPKALSTLALMSDTIEEQDALLSQGEDILSGGCVSHCHFFFFSDAMAIKLARQDWDGALRYAACLEEFTQSEPLPLMDLTIRQARLLVRSGRDGSSEILELELDAFRHDCAEANIKKTLSGLFDQLPILQNLV
jgi:class 3 adenylate cyclase/tetratricopeptide (TPR) repeat protein